MARIIDVDMNDWKPGSRGDVLRTIGVDSCVAVALSSTRTGRGYLGHFSDENFNLADQMIAVAIRQAAGEKLWLWYGGAAELGKEEPGARDMNREMRLVRALFNSKLRRREFRLRNRLWLPVRKIMSVELTCGSDRCAMQLAPRVAY